MVNNMTKQEMIEKMIIIISDANSGYTNRANQIYDLITQTHYLVEKDKVEVVELKEQPKYEYDRGVYIEATPRGKPAIPKEYIL